MKGEEVHGTGYEALAASVVLTALTDYYREEEEPEQSSAYRFLTSPDCGWYLAQVGMDHQRFLAQLHRRRLEGGTQRMRWEDAA